ncbi:DUF551 domain-containing protein [Salmonella enterica subsp. enterica serovar Typhimurium]|uniref:DUF551 domain-containing protein n=1 Tax=Salmonella enterica TaxID=28901 RepID=UPI002158342A|nr:DUF551 domain-containing protein [Salmonella enterica]MCR8603270.1 DUF551 domain-containing protein [Salmonella enterica subsp. enterica serovar Typhimurium]
MNWVSVNEALPELKDDYVLVCSVDGSKYDDNGFPEGGIDLVHIQDYFDDITAGWDENGKQLYAERYIEMGITHWMYLPELPEEAK